MEQNYNKTSKFVISIDFFAKYKITFTYYIKLKKTDLYNLQDDLKI